MLRHAKPMWWNLPGKELPTGRPAGLLAISIKLQH
jgi:hypothetical protein